MKKQGGAIGFVTSGFVADRYRHAARVALRRAIVSVACAGLLVGTAPAPLRAQESAPAQTTAAQVYSAEQLDALLAPIALYPDELLAQILIAAAYPIEVIAAARWLQTPANRALSGDALTQALAQQSWDPSVKSLVPFPDVLAMMNEQLDWLQQLGYAMDVEQNEVLASIQRLRRQAEIAGQLKTTEHQLVRTEGQVIVIEPAQPNVVYVPVYNPAVVYGAWSYPSYPPVYFPPPPGYVAGTALMAGLAFGAGVAITAGLWGWASPRWGYGNVNINVNRYNAINVNRRPITDPAWRPNNVSTRPTGGWRAPPGPVGTPARPASLPANGITRPNGSTPGGVTRPAAGTGTGNRAPVNGGGPVRPAGGQNAGTRPAGGPNANTRPAGGPNAGTRPGGGQNTGTRPATGQNTNVRPGGGQGASAPASRPAAQPASRPGNATRPSVNQGGQNTSARPQGGQNSNLRPGGGRGLSAPANRPAGQPAPRQGTGNRPAIGQNGAPRPGGGQPAPRLGNRPGG